LGLLGLFPSFTFPRLGLNPHLTTKSRQALLSALKRRVAELEEELVVLNSTTSSSSSPSASSPSSKGGGDGGGQPQALSLSTFLSQLEPHELEARVRCVTRLH